MHAHFLPINLLFFSESWKPKDNSTHSLKSKVDTEILGLKTLPGEEKFPSAQKQQIWLPCPLSLSHHTKGNTLGEGMVQKGSAKGKQSFGEGMVQKGSAKGKQSFGSGDPSVVYEP